jgi:hypothetical protein
VSARLTNFDRECLADELDLPKTLSVIPNVNEITVAQ